MSCSKTKQTSLDEIPALQRYDGPPFRVVRRFINDPISEEKEVDIFILSAAYGLIPANQPIGNYDLKMNNKIAEELCPGILNKLSNIFSKSYSQVFILLSKEYFSALSGWEELIPPSIQIFRSQASEGKRLRELKNWLYQKDMTVDKNEKPTIVTGRAAIKGVVIEVTPAEITQFALLSLKDSKGEPFNFRDWYCLIGNDIKVSTKWLVSRLSGLNVSEFQASDARRVLGQLGVPVYRKL